MAIDTTDTVTATLRYFSPPEDGAKPYIYINADASSGQRQRNWTTVPHEVQIENIRGREDTVSLDTTGFQYFRRPAKHTTFENDEVIEKEYYAESIELVKELTGASRAVVFDHSECRMYSLSQEPGSDRHPTAIRRRRPGEIEDSPQKRQPVPQVHIDQTPASARARVQRHLPEEDVPKLLAGRFQIINLWRPISHPAYDWPLALCDYRSVDRENDLVPTTLKYPDRDGETYSVKFNPGNKWKYLRGMAPEEVVFIKW